MIMRSGGLWAALRWLLALALVLGLAAQTSRALVQQTLPMLRAALAWTAPDFEVLEVTIVDDGARGTLVGAVARQERTLLLGGRAVMPEPTALMAVSATLGGVVLPLWTGVLLALAWPGRFGQTLLRLPLLAPMLALALLLDTPMCLAAWLWIAQLRQYDPGAFSPLVAWSTFLNGGGRVVLGGLAGVAAVMLARLACGVAPGTMIARAARHPSLSS